MDLLRCLFGKKTVNAEVSCSCNCHCELTMWSRLKEDRDRDIEKERQLVREEAERCKEVKKT